DGSPVAFDYGEGATGTLRYVYASNDGLGLGVSPFGQVITHDRWPPVPGLLLDIDANQMGRMGMPSYFQTSNTSYSRWSDQSARDLEKYSIREMYPGGIVKGSGAILLYDSSGQLVTNNALRGVPTVVSGLKLDLKGNIFVGLPMPKLLNGTE